MKNISLSLCLSLFIIVSCDLKSLDTPDQNKAVESCNGHEYVDLGLPSGVKWASTNIGASSVSDFGYYISWAETSPDASGNYSEATNKYYNNNTPIKYTAKSKQFKLDKSDDAAYVNWGDEWRMPDVSDVKELVSNTTVTGEIINGINVVKVTSKINGKSIYIPLGGYKSYSESTYSGSQFNIATSELINNYVTSDHFYKSDGYCACFKGNSSMITYGYMARYCGMNIRPVYGQAKEGTSGTGNDGSSSGGGGGSSYSQEKPDVVWSDYTEYKASAKVRVTFKVTSDSKVTSVKIYGGTTSNPQTALSTSSAGVLATAYYTGMKSGNTYYFKCVAKNSAGSTTSDVYDYYYYY